jgi:serine/threonine protein kinase
MAPERFLGSGDARGDVYSLGVTLYELLTRQPAFTGRDRGEMLDRIARSEFVTPRKIRANIPWELEAISLKAMSKYPQDRYQSAREMRRELMRFVQGQPISLDPPSLHSRLFGWFRKRLFRSK